jgi:hypothetical protein
MKRKKDIGGEEIRRNKREGKDKRRARKIKKEK